MSAPRPGPLAGIRAIELAGIGPAPFAAMSLADMGADVIRIERPGGAEMSTAPPEQDVLNRGKRSVILDLKAPRGLPTLRRLIEASDVLLEGYRPGVAERLGAGPEVALERNPRLVYARLTGWGQEGPLSMTAGHEINYLAIGGFLGALGPADGPPQVPPPMIGDYGGGGAYAVIGILAALNETSRTGRGQVVDIAMVDGVAHLMAATYSMLGAGRWTDRRGANLLDGGSPFYAVYETSDGRWISVGALERKFFVELLQGLEIAPEDFDPADQSDQAQWPRLRELLTAAFRGRSQRAWIAHFAGTDACVTPVLSLREGAMHPHLAARRSVLTEAGAIQPGPAPRFDSTDLGPPGSPPRPGAQTVEVLAELGLPVEELIAEGAARAE